MWSRIKAILFSRQISPCPHISQTGCLIPSANRRVFKFLRLYAEFLTMTSLSGRGAFAARRRPSMLAAKGSKCETSISQRSAYF